MPTPKRKLYDAFPTKQGAISAARDLNAVTAASCDASVRKLKQPQDGGRLKFGVYVKASCNRG